MQFTSSYFTPSYRCSGADYHLPNCGGTCGAEDDDDSQTHDPVLETARWLVEAAESAAKTVNTLTDRLLAVEKRLDELEHYVGRIIRQDKNPY